MTDGRRALQARSALFDLYGDHVRPRGGGAPVAALVRLLAALDIAAPAVRTAISRMVRQGWLLPTSTASGPGYALTPRASRRLDQAAERIYRLRPVEPWDGRWSLVVVPRPQNRTGRERLHRALEYVGYRSLGTDTWVAPRPALEVETVLAAEGLAATFFLSELQGDDHGLVGRLWDPPTLAARYRTWIAQARAITTTAWDVDDERAFAIRSALVHEWRKFLFADPGLPRELLPDPWAGDEAAAYFDEWAARLAPAATRFVDGCLAGAMVRP